MRTEAEIRSSLRHWEAIAGMKLSDIDFGGASLQEIAVLSEEHQQTVRRARITAETLHWVLGGK